MIRWELQNFCHISLITYTISPGLYKTSLKLNFWTCFRASPFLHIGPNGNEAFSWRISLHFSKSKHNILATARVFSRSGHWKWANNRIHSDNAWQLLTLDLVLFNLGKTTLSTSDCVITFARFWCVHFLRRCFTYYWFLYNLLSAKAKAKKITNTCQTIHLFISTFNSIHI